MLHSGDTAASTTHGIVTRMHPTDDLPMLLADAATAARHAYAQAMSTLDETERRRTVPQACHSHRTTGVKTTNVRIGLRLANHQFSARKAGSAPNPAAQRLGFPS